MYRVHLNHSWSKKIDASFRQFSRVFIHPFNLKHKKDTHVKITLPQALTLSIGLLVVKTKKLNNSRWNCWFGYLCGVLVSPLCNVRLRFTHSKKTQFWKLQKMSITLIPMKMMMTRHRRNFDIIQREASRKLN